MLWNSITLPEFSSITSIPSYYITRISLSYITGVPLHYHDSVILPECCYFTRAALTRIPLCHQILFKKYHITLLKFHYIIRFFYIITIPLCYQTSGYITIIPLHDGSITLCYQNSILFNSGMLSNLLECCYITLS